MSTRTYWLIERGSPAEWWAGNHTTKCWTRDVNEVHPLLKFERREQAQGEADRIKRFPEVFGSDLRVTEHLDMTVTPAYLHYIEAECDTLRALNAELQKYADVGESFMEALRIGCPNYSWCDTPAEFVADKLTVIDEMEALNTQLAEALQGLLPEDWRDGVMDHMPGVKAAREALAAQVKS